MRRTGSRHNITPTIAAALSFLITVASFIAIELF
jgi:hypothetical protein